MIDKTFTSSAEAVADIPDGATVMLGGFGLCGIPENLIRALVERGTKNLHTISNNMGTDGAGMGLLLEENRIASHVGSYVGENKLLESRLLNGEINVSLIPQGTLAERIRAGGAGIPAFFTPAGAGTTIADGKEVKTFGGREYLLEHALTADFALIKAWKGDRMGNLIYRKTARNFNPLMAAAARVTIAEVEQIVEQGELAPDEIVTPGIYVQRIVQGEHFDRRIERRVVRKSVGQGDPGRMSPEQEKRERIVRRASRELRDGFYVNLGIGMPTLLADRVPAGVHVILQSENGMLGIGEYPIPGSEDADLINAGKETITEVPGTSYFSGAESFAMIRGGHIDLSILGAMEVSERGDLANWMVPGKLIKGMGGAMDLVASARRVIVLMEHTTKSGAPKILRNCSLPLTGCAVVDTIITELAVMQITPGGVVIHEIAPGWTLAKVQDLTEARLVPDPRIREMK